MANHVNYRCQRCGKYVGEDCALIAEYKDTDGFDWALCWIMCNTCLWLLLTFVEFYTGVTKGVARELFNKLHK